MSRSAISRHGRSAASLTAASAAESRMSRGADMTWKWRNATRRASAVALELSRLWPTQVVCQYRAHGCPDLFLSHRQATGGYESQPPLARLWVRHFPRVRRPLTLRRTSTGWLARESQGRV